MMPEKYSQIVVNFLVRAVVGLVMIFFINEFLSSQDIALSVGMNPVTFIASGTFGAPGVALMYGITFYQGL